MEFFAKAHVRSKKNSKAEELMKKNLKAMLHGYRKSDNELIKRSASGNIIENNWNFDASNQSEISISLTSGSEEDVNQSHALKTSSSNDIESRSSTVTKSETDYSESQDSNDSSVEHKSLSATESEADQTESQDSNDKSMDDVVIRESSDNESISECDEEIESLSDENESGDSDSIHDIPPIIIDGSTTEAVSSDSEGFDPDGALASKIFEKLGKTKDESSHRGKKRKLENVPKKKKSKKNHTEYMETVKNENIVEIEALSISDDTTSTDVSAPYVSISATEMPDQSFSDLLGNYNYPTVKHIQDAVKSIDTERELFKDGCSEFVVNDASSLVPRLTDEDEGDNYEGDALNDEKIDQVDEHYENDDDPVEVIDQSKEDDGVQGDEEDIGVPDDEQDDNVQVVEDVGGPGDGETNNDQTTADRSPSMDVVPLEEFEKQPEDENFQCPVKVYYGQDSYICVLRHPTSLYLNGKVRVTLLAGAVKVLGHMVKDKVKLYAPNNSHSLCLTTVEKPQETCGLLHKLISEGVIVQEAEDIVTSLMPNDCVIVMRTLSVPSIDFIEEYMNTELCSKSKTVESVLRPISMDLGCNLYLTKPWRHFQEGENWEIAVKYGLRKLSRGIICGGKGLGKSTFLRYYVNKLLEEGPVLVIDVDPGQPEFTVAGMVSATVVTMPLLGPNYTHLKNPEVMYYIGMINTMDNCERYASAIADVLCDCHARFNKLRWVVNTMGMCNNMGLKFLVHTILHTQPTFVVQIDSKIPKKRFECELTYSNVQDLYEGWKDIKMFKCCAAPELLYSFVYTKAVEGCGRHNTSRSPKDDRYMNYLAYFGKLMNINSRARSLVQIVPYEVKLSDLHVLTNVKVTGDILKVINAKIVALCRTNPPPTGEAKPMGDTSLLCYGHGLVRSVDFAKRLVYIVTPVQNLQPVNTLVYADWAPEMCAPDAVLPAGVPVPYVSTPHQQQKQLLTPPRRRFNPLQLLKMSRIA